jgi:hypothetical protein
VKCGCAETGTENLVEERMGMDALRLIGNTWLMCKEWLSRKCGRADMGSDFAVCNLSLTEAEIKDISSACYHILDYLEKNLSANRDVYDRYVNLCNKLKKHDV